MSKAKYHVPQPGELVEFQNAGGLREKVIVSKWDSKHGIITSIGAAKYQVGDRSTIKLVGPSPSTAPKDDKAAVPPTRRPTVWDWVEVIKVIDHFIMLDGRSPNADGEAGAGEPKAWGQRAHGARAAAVPPPANDPDLPF